MSIAERQPAASRVCRRPAMVRPHGQAAFLLATPHRLESRLRRSPRHAPPRPANCNKASPQTCRRGIRTRQMRPARAIQARAAAAIRPNQRCGRQGRRLAPLARGTLIPHAARPQTAVGLGAPHQEVTCSAPQPLKRSSKWPSKTPTQPCGNRTNSPAIAGLSSRRGPFATPRDLQRSARNAAGNSRQGHRKASPPKCSPASQTPSPNADYVLKQSCRTSRRSSRVRRHASTPGRSF